MKRMTDLQHLGLVEQILSDEFGIGVDGWSVDELYKMSVLIGEVARLKKKTVGRKD